MHQKRTFATTVAMGLSGTTAETWAPLDINGHRTLQSWAWCPTCHNGATIPGYVPGAQTVGEGHFSAVLSVFLAKRLNFGLGN